MLATALEWRQKWIAFRCDIKWLFAYKKKEYKPQAVPGHGDGGGVSRRKGQVGADTKFLQKKDVCPRQTFWLYLLFIPFGIALQYQKCMPFLSLLWLPQQRK